MKAELGLGIVLLTACGGGSGQGPGQSQERARAEAARAEAARVEAAGVEAGRSDVAGGEASEFGGDIAACPEIASSEPLALDDPEVASWVAMAQGHHEQTLGWRRLVFSDEVSGFAEHTSVSIDVAVRGGREVVYGSGGNSADYELGGCDGLRARQIELEIALATADGAAAITFRSWFQPWVTDSGGIFLHHHGLNPDGSGVVDMSGALELKLDPALGGTPHVGLDIEFHADSVQGSLYPEVSPDVVAWNRSSWRPIEAIFPDQGCGSQQRPIGLDESFADIGAPRAYYRRVAAAWEREPLPAVWKSPPSGVELSPLDVPPPTTVRLDAGEPTHACADGSSVTVYAPLTVTTADGRVNLTQTFGSTLYAPSAHINERTPWVPAADFDEHTGLDGVNLPSGYGSIYLQNSVEWRDARVEGSLEVSQWDAFTDRVAAYPVLEWCSGLCIYYRE
jgi:hypothetical protein